MATMYERVTQALYDRLDLISTGSGYGLNLGTLEIAARDPEEVSSFPFVGIVPQRRDVIHKLSGVVDITAEYALLCHVRPSRSGRDCLVELARLENAIRQALYSDKHLGLGGAVIDGIWISTESNEGDPGSFEHKTATQLITVRIHYVDTEHEEDLFMSSFGSCYVSSASTTSVTTGNAFVKMAGTTTAGDLQDMTHPTDNRLLYSGTVAKKFKITASCSVTVDPTGSVKIAIAKNGTEITGADLTIGSSVGAGAVSWVTELSENDYVEIFVTSSSIESVTIGKATLTAVAA